jgi:DNA polymerase eta
LSFSGLERLEGGQKGIEGFFKSGAMLAQARKRSRSPTDASGPSSSRASNVRHKGSRDVFPATTPQSVVPEIIEVLDDSDSDLDVAARPSFYCKKCDKTIRSTRKLEIEEEKNLAIEALRQEHSDYHIARDLHKEDIVGNGRHPKDSTNQPAKKKRAAMKKPEGIRAFFVPKETAAPTSKNK